MFQQVFDAYTTYTYFYTYTVKVDKIPLRNRGDYPGGILHHSTKNIKLANFFRQLCGFSCCLKNQKLFHVNIIIQKYS